MKVTYWLFTPRETKDFLAPINWELLNDTFSGYINQITPIVQVKFPNSINVWWLQSIIADLIGKITGKMTWWTYTLSSGNIQLNTTANIIEYSFLLTINHELAHALWFNDPKKHRSGYSIWRKYNSLNEWVIQKIAEEVTDEFLIKTDIGDKRTMYLMQLARKFAFTILWSGDLLEKSKQIIPSIWKIMEADMDSKEASLAIAKELYNHPEIRADIEQKTEKIITDEDVYVKEVSVVNQLISVLSIHSGKSEQEVWQLIKRWYFEGIDIVELCTHPQYWIGYDKWELMKLIY